MELIQKHGAHDWVFFQCKSSEKRYQQARALDPHVALLFKATSPENEMHGKNEMLKPELIEKVHASGKLVLVNAWKQTALFEFFGAGCKKSWDLGADIAISNRPEHCASQKGSVSLNSFHVEGF